MPDTTATGFNRFGDKSFLMTALVVAGRSPPGDYAHVRSPELDLQAAAGLAPARQHVLTAWTTSAGHRRVWRGYKGPFSILNSGVADGHSRKRSATRYLGMEDSIVSSRLR
jgi:hypothetical protein